ncbi:hypothetical protein AB5I41_26345 [Sphingomonas sp. MMS24-JH45]
MTDLVDRIAALIPNGDARGATRRYREAMLRLTNQRAARPCRRRAGTGDLRPPRHPRGRPLLPHRRASRQRCAREEPHPARLHRRRRGRGRARGAGPLRATTTSARPGHRIRHVMTAPRRHAAPGRHRRRPVRALRRAHPRPDRIRPIILDRGKVVRERTKDTWGLWRRGRAGTPNRTSSSARAAPAPSPTASSSATSRILAT